MNELMSLLETDKLPQTFEESAIGNGGGAEDKAGLKRKREGGEVESDILAGVVPPANDIYRSRQQKRVHVSWLMSQDTE